MTTDSGTGKAGRQLDIEIHSKVFRHKLLSLEEMEAEANEVWKTQPLCRVFLKGFTAWDHFDGTFTFTQQCPAYSSDIRAAWTVVEHMATQGFSTNIEWKGSDREYPFSAEAFMRQWGDGFQTIGHGLGTLPEAICLAALRCCSRLSQMRDASQALVALREDPTP